MRVWVAADGRLSDGVRDYQPQAGVSAAGAVLTVFGLTKVRRFAATELLAAAYYAAQLRTEKGLDRGVNRRAVL
jgi:hypothetical protein